MRSVNVVMTIDPLFMSDTALCQGDTLWTVDNIPVIPLCRSIGQTLNLLNALILGVDGNWSSWGKPGPCDKTCGGGVRKIKRTCTNPPPSGDGKKCKGLSIKTKSCNTQKCKLVTISVPPPFVLTSYLPLLGRIVRPWLVKETRNNTNLRFFRIKLKHKNWHKTMHSYNRKLGIENLLVSSRMITWDLQTHKIL